MEPHKCIVKVFDPIHVYSQKFNSWRIVTKFISWHSTPNFCKTVAHVIFATRHIFQKNNKSFKMMVWVVVCIIDCLATDQQQITRLYWEWSKHTKVLLILKQIRSNTIRNSTMWCFLTLFLVCTLFDSYHTHMVHTYKNVYAYVF